MGSETAGASDPKGANDHPTTSDTTTSSSTNACEESASWSARRDFAFEPSDADDSFANDVGALIRESASSAIAVSAHMDPGCVWKVAFSALDSTDGAAAAHAAAFTTMLRHPAGLWTAAPQAAGWLRVVDRTARTIWVPIVGVTGSASYGDISCASLATVRVSATIPPSAADLSLTTASGAHTVRELMGSPPSPLGWNVRFTFSADLPR